MVNACSAFFLPMSFKIFLNKEKTNLQNLHIYNLQVDTSFVICDKLDLDRLRTEFM